MDGVARASHDSLLQEVSRCPWAGLMWVVRASGFQRGQPERGQHAVQPRPLLCQSLLSVLWGTWPAPPLSHPWGQGPLILAPFQLRLEGCRLEVSLAT